MTVIVDLPVAGFESQLSGPMTLRELLEGGVTVKAMPQTGLFWLALGEPWYASGYGTSPWRAWRELLVRCRVRRTESF